MATEAVLEAELDALEREWRRVAMVIDPHHRGVVNQDPPLSQQPVCELRFVTGGRVETERQARDVQHAGGVAPHRELRSLQRQLLETQIDEKQRRPRQGQVHCRQAQQRCTALAVDDTNVLGIEAGIPAIPARGERTELYRLPDLLREQLGDLSAMAFELGKDDVANCKKQDAEGG